MSVLVLPAVILATAVVVLSGLWVTIALVRAIWRVDRLGSAPSAEPADKNTP